MKHLYILALSALFTHAGFSQADAPESVSMPSAPGRTGNFDFDRSTPFWQEDFGGGLPSDWVVIDSSGICPWRYSTDGSWGYFSSTGTSSGDPGITSTTGGNGFLICDNDSANQFNYGQPSGTTYQYLASYFGTPSIDCSTHSSVILRFEQSYRYNNGVAMYVMVSTDSVNWTVFNVSGGIANNTASADPDVEVLNLSSIASNQPNVYLRFGWRSRVYFWMIDDISLSEADPNDVALQSKNWGTGANGYQYRKIPMTQASPITFYAGLTNNTGTTMSNAYFDIAVTNGSTVFSGTSNHINLAATQLDTAYSTTNWTPATTGDYYLQYTAGVQSVTDGNMTNNSGTDSLMITSSIYGFDNRALNYTGAANGISNWSGNTGSSFGIGNLYEIINDDEIQCIQIGVTSAAQNEGNLIFGAVYYWDGAAWAYLGLTPDYTVTAADLGTIVSIPFDQGIAVNSGDEVVIIAGHYGGNDVEFMMAQTVPNHTVYGYDVDNNWYYLSNPKALVVRANFNCGLGTEEFDLANELTYYPNPAGNTLTVNIPSDVIQGQLYIHDSCGKLIESLQVNGGTQTIDVSNLPGGVYTLNFTDETRTSTGKFLVSH